MPTTARQFSGNPAGVVLLDEFPDDAWMQGVANEIHQSETAFLVRDDQPGGFRLRWFTPIAEVALCGHATLASAHWLWASGTLPKDTAAAFTTRSGPLTAERQEEDRIVLDFPAIPATQVPPSADIVASLRGTIPMWTGITANNDPGERNMLAVLESEEHVRRLTPDLQAITRLPVGGLIITARSEVGGGVVSRYFAPAFGIPEDPVTGSAHCTIGPYWRDELGTTLAAEQASPRGGALTVVTTNTGRVRPSGKATRPSPDSSIESMRLREPRETHQRWQSSPDDDCHTPNRERHRVPRLIGAAPPSDSIADTPSLTPRRPAMTDAKAAASSRLLTGLSAFPLTPVADQLNAGIDESAFSNLIARLADANVDSITVLGSTGSYAYLTGDERRRVVQLAVTEAGDVPVLAGVGATRTRDVLRHAEEAQEAGAAGLLLAPVTYQPLCNEEVYGLFADVNAVSSVPVVVYDNPGTTHFTFSDALHARIARLPSVASIKIPPEAGGPEAMRERIDALRSQIPTDVTIGISGDYIAADALNAGCQAWYSVLGGTLPDACQVIVDAAAAGNTARAVELSDRLQPLWDLFLAHGSFRVVSALAEELGLVRHPNLPRPVLGLDATARQQVQEAMKRMRINGVPGLDPQR